MPELPEVEVLAGSLRPHLVGRRIEDVAVSCSALREPVRAEQLRRRCCGRRIEAVRRRAKYLLLDLEHDSTLVVHLGMSGRLTLTVPSRAVEEHEHLSFGISGRRRLRYRDPRRFGLVLVRPTSSLERDPHFSGLGIEPLSEDLDGRWLAAAAYRRRAPVKSFLMDARIVVGIGNIYACEALHRARIHPRRSVARISLARWETLADSIRSVLAEAIAQGGTTLNDFADGSGNQGYFQVALSVYGLEGEACRRCGGEIRRIVQAGRSTFYCWGCQR
jgi:formamidopyrimidine-DNA glycosylase